MEIKYPAMRTKQFKPNKLLLPIGSRLDLTLRSLGEHDKTAMLESMRVSELVKTNVSLFNVNKQRQELNRSVNLFNTRQSPLRM